MRRGWVREAMLALLAERPMHGYEMISELGARTGGTWRPSPGSVYPTLQALEEEGLVAVVADGGRRSYALTDAGRHVATPADRPSPWADFPAAPKGDALLRAAAGQLNGAVEQVLLAGSPDQQDRVAQLLAQTRRTVYAILAEDLATPAGTPATSSASEEARPGERHTPPGVDTPTAQPLPLEELQ